MSEKGLIFDIQAFSVHDGPGCRTNVFFAGCPLHCQWCANPECFGHRRHIMYAERICKWGAGCRACTDICPYGSLSFATDRTPLVNWEICNNCKTFECTKVCASNALKMCGKEYTVEELMKILIRDFNNWGAEGGVTFTGGEPLLHHDYLLAVLKQCYRAQIHTAIETSTYVANKNFLEIMDYIHFAFMDVKNMDRDKHKEGTGVYNDQILENIASLKKSGWQGRAVLRQPTIAGFNDSTDNALRLIEFMTKNGYEEINLLKFHRLGQTKWEQLGKEYAYATGGDMTQERMEELQALYLDNDIICYIGDNTPF
ncbi:MAG: 4-hydroxyphenylacetate decarboxylase activase [Acidaminococcaceae bacterium]